MQTIELGTTGLMVSEVGFGGIPIQRLSEEEAVRVVRHCLDLGVTFLDTAHAYTTSQARIGKAIAGRRQGLVLATKNHGLDGETFRERMEISFDRLGLQHIDLYQLHNVTEEEELESILVPGGPLDVAREAKAAGRIGHIGVTSHSPEMAKTLVKSGHFETLMFPFNFIMREPAEDLIPLCRERGVGFIAMKPMGGGLLEKATLAFKFLRQYPDALPLVGIQAFEEIEQIVAVMEGPAELTEAEEAEMARLREELGTRFCRACGYCQPCPQEISISSVLRLRSHAKRFSAERFFGEWGQSMVAKAETCVECGDCEPRCPYDLPIREMIRENVAWYREQEALYEAGKLS